VFESDSVTSEPSPSGTRLLARLGKSDLWWAFRRSVSAQLGAAILGLVALGAILAPVLAPQDPYDLTVIDIVDAYKPPFFVQGGDSRFPLGTDDQGRDILSSVLYGSRVSIFVGVASVVLAVMIGATLGMIAGFGGGSLDSTIMRIADIELSFPSVLIALFIMVFWAPGVRNIIVAIAAVEWVLYARAARASVLVEREKGYVEAAQVTGVSVPTIIVRHLAPNIAAPILAIANVRFAWVIILEASLSFLGAGVPAERPSLGRLILNGYQVLFSGLWWTSVFPGMALVVLVLGVNLLGDWLRDALNPRVTK
jgi:peptide/nickel transport system permease protein